MRESERNNNLEEQIKIEPQDCLKFAAVWQKKKKGGKFNGQRSLVGYSPWSHKELDRTAPAHWGKKNKQLGSFPPVPEYTAVDFLRFMPTACLLWKTGKPEPPKCRREKLFVFTLHRKENSI